MINLDASQRSFCEAPNTNIRLLAPAGCGKTLCLLHRCNHLAQLTSDHNPRFLIVAFTVAARQELQARINDDVSFSDIANQVEITTLNSWGWRRVRNTTFSPRLITSNIEKHSTVVNQLQAIWQEHPSVQHSIESKQRLAPRRIMEAIDTLKSIGFDHTRHTTFDSFSRHCDSIYDQQLGWHFHQQLSELIKYDIIPENIEIDIPSLQAHDRRTIYDSFYTFWLDATSHLRRTATFTLEDQKYISFLDETTKLTEKSKLSGAASYDHVLVDEFQDINPLDLNLIKAIVQRNRASLTIVGDDDQAIFEWRGATPEYILNPDKYFGTPFDTHILNINYRSPRNVVYHSQRLISHNSRRVDKDIRAYSNDQAEIEVRKTDSLTDALEYVQGIVTAAIEAGSSPTRVAVVGRKRSQIIPFQVHFASQDVPFCAAEDLQVFLSDAFERLLELIAIKSRANDHQRKGQVIADIIKLLDLAKRYPVNKKEKEALRRYFQGERLSSLTDAVAKLYSYRGNLKGQNKEGVRSIEMADAVQEFLQATTISDALLTLSEHFLGLQIDLGKAEDDIFYTDPPFWHLAEFADRYGDDYERFVDDIELAKDQLVYVPPIDDGTGNETAELWQRPLHLMTALRAKGKEFDVVVMLGAVDGIWPSKNAKTPEQKEAERRVFYVAFTRARKRIVILVDRRVGNQEAIPSPYIPELGLHP